MKFNLSVTRKKFKSIVGCSMNRMQCHMSNIIDEWVNKSLSKTSKIMRLYTGESLGHTTLWKVIKKSYPDDVVIVAINQKFAEMVFYPEETDTLKTLPSRIDLEGKLVIFDLGGCHNIVSHEYILDIRNRGVLGIILS